jgi:hypothetical protein
MALVRRASALPRLSSREGSWVGTSPAGEVREFYSRQKAERALNAGWRLETIGAYLGRVNRTVRDQQS